MRRTGLVSVLAIAAATCVALLASGCGAKPTIARITPKATAQAFVKAVKEGDYEAVAAGYDYETSARRANPDWGQIPRSQRNLIVGKLREQRAREVEALTGMMLGDVVIGTPEVEGDRATVLLSVGMQTVALDLIKVKGFWKVLQITEQQRQ